MRSVIILSLLFISYIVGSAQNRISVPISVYSEDELIKDSGSFYNEAEDSTITYCHGKYIPSYVKDKAILFESSDDEAVAVTLFNELINRISSSPSILFHAEKIIPKSRVNGLGPTNDINPDLGKATDNFICMNPYFEGSSVIVATLDDKSISPYLSDANIIIPKDSISSAGIKYSKSPIPYQLCEGMDEVLITVYDRNGNKREIYFPNRACNAHAAIYVETKMVVHDNEINSSVSSLANFYYVEMNDGEYRGIMLPEWSSLKKDIVVPSTIKNNEAFINLAYRVAYDEVKKINTYLDSRIENATVEYFSKMVGEGGKGMIIDNKYFESNTAFKDYCAANPDFITPNFEIMPYQLDEKRGVIKIKEFIDIEGNIHNVDSIISHGFGVITTNDDKKYLVDISDYSLYDYGQYEPMMWDTRKEELNISLDALWWQNDKCPWGDIQWCDYTKQWGDYYRTDAALFGCDMRRFNYPQYYQKIFNDYCWIKGKELYNNNDGTLWRCVALTHTPLYSISHDTYSVDFMVYYTILQNINDQDQIIIAYPRYLITSDRAEMEVKTYKDNNPFILWETKGGFILKEPMDWFKNHVENDWFCWRNSNKNHFPYGNAYFRIIEGPKFYPKSSEVKDSGVYFLVEDKYGKKGYLYYFGAIPKLLFYRRDIGFETVKRDYILYTAKEREKQNAEEQAQYAEVRKRALKHFPENVFKSSRVGMKYSDFVGVLQLYSTEAKWNHCTEEEVLKMIVESDVSTDYKGDKIKTIKVGNVKYTFINNWLYRIDKQ